MQKAKNIHLSVTCNNLKTYGIILTGSCIILTIASANLTIACIILADAGFILTGEGIILSCPGIDLTGSGNRLTKFNNYFELPKTLKNGLIRFSQIFGLLTKTHQK